MSIKELLQRSRKKKLQNDSTVDRPTQIFCQLAYEEVRRLWPICKKHFGFGGAASPMSSVGIPMQRGGEVGNVLAFFGHALANRGRPFLCSTLVMSVSGCKNIHQNKHFFFAVAICKKENSGYDLPAIN